MVLFWSAISVFPGGTFNLPTVTFKDRGFSGLYNDFHCLNVDVWVSLSKEINSIFLNWKWTEKLRGFIDFLCLGLGVLVKQSMEVNSSTSTNWRSHFQGHKLRKMWINIIVLAVRLGQSTFLGCINNIRIYPPGNELQTNSSFLPEVTVFCWYALSWD